MTADRWTPALRTGEPDIDSQHIRLFALADILNSTCGLECDEEDRVADAVYELAEYVVEHFADEEAFMDECGYPEAGPHRALHEHLSAGALRFAADYMNGADVEPGTLGPFVTTWLTDHILTEDMRMVEWARAHGEAENGGSE